MAETRYHQPDQKNGGERLDFRSWREMCCFLIDP